MIVERFDKINSKIKKTGNKNINIVAVSKTFELNHIMPLIEHGHLHYGENKVQEAESKWRDIRKDRTDLKLHMVGKLQSNKAKKAVEVFDYIHSLDNQKLADILSKSQNAINKSINYFIQVNIGNEEQKNGIEIENLDSFYLKCTTQFDLKIIGLMCLPPANNSATYFSKIRDLNNNLKLKELSMGMSNDYLEACEYKSTFLRIGSKIFGKRT